MRAGRITVKEAWESYLRGPHTAAPSEQDFRNGWNYALEAVLDAIGGGLADASDVRRAISYMSADVTSRPAQCTKETP